MLDGVAEGEESFDGEYNEKHGVGVIDVEHEAGDEAEENPLRDGAVVASAQPVREENGDDESGVRVRPGGVEIHVDGERAAAPDAKRSEDGATFGDEFFGETKRKEECEKAVEGGAEGHGEAVGSRKTVGGNGRPKGASDENAGVRGHKEWSPKNGGANGEMIFKMAGGCAEIGARLAGFVEAAFAETGVGALVVGGEIEIVLNKKSAGVSVISDAVAADPRIGERQRKKKEEDEQALGKSEKPNSAEQAGIVFHERSIRQIEIPEMPTVLRKWGRMPRL